MTALGRSEAVAASALLDAVFDAPDARTGAAQREPVLRRRGWLVRRMLVAADAAGLVIAFAISAIVLGSTGAGDHVSVRAEIVFFLLTLPAWVLLAKLHGLYDRDEERADHPTADDAVGVFHLTTVGAWIFFVACWVTGLADPDLLKLVTFWALATAIVPVGRAVARAWCRKQPAYLQNAIIVGAGDVGQLVARKLLKHPEYGINLVGFIDTDPKERRGDLEFLTLIGGPDRLGEAIALLDVERVIVAFSREADDDVMSIIRSLRELDVQIDIVPRLFELIGPRADVHSVEGLPLLGLPPVRLSRSSRIIKRALDIVVASIALVVTAPLFAFIAWRISRDSPGPVLFRQTRYGMSMREFTALKFRTMHVDVDQGAHRDYIAQIMSPKAALGANGLYKLDRRDAITNVGRWLRKTSLDELPQLLNVLKGDMSLVGPRPCIPYETEHFAPHQFERFLVPQGITGLWQVTARASASFGEALDMDVTYARGWSLGLDLRLICRTPLALLRQRTATT